MLQNLCVSTRGPLSAQHELPGEALGRKTRYHGATCWAFAEAQLFSSSPTQRLSGSPLLTEKNLKFLSIVALHDLAQVYVQVSSPDTPYMSTLCLSPAQV